MKKIVVTGSSGCIGSIIKEQLKDFELFLLDKKEIDGDRNFKIDIAKEHDGLVEIFKDKDIVLHLAWNFFEDFPKETIDPDNKKMAENIYSAAVIAKVKRIIIASSVHANDYSRFNDIKEFDNENPIPDSPYGASKVYIESLGKYYANYHNLEVVCIRFGGVNKNDIPIYEEDPNYDKVLLYKKDCSDLIRNCIAIESIPNNFQILTAVSNNKNRVHDINNFLNWKPNFPKNE